MSIDYSKFNTADLPPEEKREFAPLQPGNYNVVVVSTEEKPTKSGGEMLVIEFDVIDGPNKNRKLFERLNLVNDNEKAEEIAFRTLGKILTAIGKTSMKSPSELQGKRFTVEVVVEEPKAGSQYGPNNRIKKYNAYGSTAGTTDMPFEPVSTPAAQGETASVPPWKRKA